ncbi:hypothetical protein WISP_147102 [Willisornis vidua]|uniref:Uncharacterized protein n=1 Tax=Willisornis vidua TaxID=1566151 RepID=A0ABQ9CKJ2_9PASS|nr:hypothetical protein WISP_147102 [Willisornis vidua]
MKFKKVKRKGLHVHWGNPKHKYRVDNEWIESSPEEKDLVLLVDEKLNMTQECAFAAQTAKCITANKSDDGSSFPVQPLPMLNYPFSEEILPDVQPELPLAQYKAVSSYPVASCLGEEVDLHLATTFFQVVVESDEVTLELSFSPG